jgi:hypothetical protein
MSEDETDKPKISADVYVRAMCRQATPEEVEQVRMYRREKKAIDGLKQKPPEPKSLSTEGNHIGDRSGCSRE